MISIKISPELNFAYLIKKGFIKSNVDYRRALKNSDFGFISSSNGYGIFLKKFEKEKHHLKFYCDLLQKQLNNFNFSNLKIAEDFFNEKLPSKIDLFVCLGNTSQVTYGKNYFSFYLLLPRGFPDKMTPQRDFQIIIHELIHSLHYKKKIEDLVQNKDLFEYVVRCFAPEGLLFGSKPVVSNLDNNKLEKVFEIVNSSNSIFDCLPDLKKIIQG